jgi:hypothetical protein
MKRLFGLALTLLFSQSVFAHTTAQDLNIKPSKTAVLSDETASSYLKVVPGKIQYFDNFPKEKQKIEEAIQVVEKVVNSNSFKSRVIGYQGTGPLGGYRGNNNLTNEEIYQFIMEGRELIDGDSTLYEMNFDLRRYYRGWSKVVARTYPGKSNWIEANGKFYSGMRVEEIAANLVHEWLHLTGFYHQSASDHESVPYKVGNIAGELAKQYLAQGYID